MKYILAIKNKHHGDVLLMTPALRILRQRFPDARITAIVRRGTESILSGCSAIDEVLLAAPAEKERRQRGDTSGLLARLPLRRFDAVFDFGAGDRGRFLALLLHRAKRYANGFHGFPFWARPFFDLSRSRDPAGLHSVERDCDLLRDDPGERLPEPILEFERSRARDTFAEEGGWDGDFVLVHPVTRWRRKDWPTGRWIEFCRALLERGERIVLSCGPSARERARIAEIAGALPDSPVQTTRGQLDWAGVAGLAYRARAFVGPDTAAMHLASACRLPVLALFGPSLVEVWRPWNLPHVVVVPPGPAFTDAMPDQEQRSLMERITVEAVLDGWDRLAKLASLPLPGTAM